MSELWLVISSVGAKQAILILLLAGNVTNNFCQRLFKVSILKSPHRQPQKQKAYLRHLVWPFHSYMTAVKKITSSKE